MEEQEPKHHIETPEHEGEHTVHHHKKKEKELSMPMAIVLGAFIIAIALRVVKMPSRTATSDSADPNALDATTVKAMVDHIMTTKNQTPVVPVSASDHITGSSDPKVTIIEYSDLECPFCKNFDTTMQKVMQNYGDQVAWVYRHFPLDCVDNTSADCTPLHPKARHEAVASECAFEQGGNDAFWQYITKVFAITPSNNQLDPAELTTIAQGMGLDMNQFGSCLSTDKYANVVSADAKEGLKSGVQGTPMIIMTDKLGNTYTVAGAYPYEVITGAIDDILKN